MRLRSRKWRWLGLVAVALVGLFAVVRTWVVPAIIAQQVRAHYGGKAIIGNWWLGWNSAGVEGVRLWETPAGETPPWLSADRITTDVSLSRLIQGQWMPTRIEVDRPSIDFRLDSTGKPLTNVPIVTADGSKVPAASAPIRLPEVIVKGGTIHLTQAGRSPLTLRGIDGRLAPGAEGSEIDVKSDDPTWGKIQVTGHLAPSLKNGEIWIATSPGFVADPEQLRSIPFIPAEVWSNIEPRGPVDARVRINLTGDSPKPVVVHTELDLKDISLTLKPLQADLRGATGRVVIDDTLVRVEELKGRTIDGSININGSLDFGRKVPQFDLAVRLRGIDVTRTPAAWQLNEVGATGRLSGRVDLKLKLDPAGPDLTGTTGRAVIEDGSFQGIPIKSLSLGLRAEKNDLQYETLPEGSVDKDRLDTPTLASSPSGGEPGPNPSAGLERFVLPGPILAGLSVIDLVTHGQGLVGWTAFALKELVAYQLKHPSDRQLGGLRLPKSITTRIELQDVELRTLIEKAAKFGVKVPFPVAGLLSIRATATIPLGSLKDVKAYAFRGDATLRGASIDHVDLGLVATHVELANGVLALTDFRGQFVDRPSGGAANPPAPTVNVASTGPLPPGAFRADLRASLAPPGAASVRVEGDHLPLGEIFAPFLPVPTPLAGEVTVRVEARADLGKLDDPNSIVLDGRIDSHRIKYLNAVLDEIISRVSVKSGRITLSEFAAKLFGKPLTAKGHLEIATPYRFDGRFRIEGWQIAEFLKLAPSIPSLPPLAGMLDAQGDASGSIAPFSLITKGAARVIGAKAGPASIGNLGFHWKTDADFVVVEGLELFAFGGKTTGGARIPLKPGEPLRASIDLKGIDSARLSSTFLPKGPGLVGRTDGRVDVVMPMDASVIDGHARIDSPELLLREGNGSTVAVRSVLVRASARNGSLEYEATAEGLGGRFRFKGTGPIVTDFSKAKLEGEMLAVGFRVSDCVKAAGLGQGLARIDGLAAFDVNVRTNIQPFQLFGRGRFELRDLRYGNRPPFANLNGVASVIPTSWRMEQLSGDVFGGVVSGHAHGQSAPGSPKDVNFDLQVERASLARLARFVPGLIHDVDGFANLRLAGRVGEAARANAEILVSRGRVLGLTITDLRLPVEIEANTATGSGTIHSRHWTARVAGGSLKGNAWNRFGHDRSFQAEVQLNSMDVEALAKFHPIGKKPPTGKVSGKVNLQGPDPEKLEKIRGRIDLTLDDTSLIELPLFKEFDRFLGSSGGGLFDNGSVQGTIANRTIYLEQMTLTGKLVQMHVLGSIGFNGNLNLEVLINTNSLISRPELALLNVIPGVGQAFGAGEEAIRRVAAVLENSLLKFRVSGSTSNPRVQLDPGVTVGSSAVGFFSSFLKGPGR